jgi:hypothetical protein
VFLLVSIVVSQHHCLPSSVISPVVGGGGDGDLADRLHDSDKNISTNVGFFSRVTRLLQIV